MQAFTVSGRSGVLTPAAIKGYRQSGFLIAKEFLSPQQTQSLTLALRAASKRRGQLVFPSMDSQHQPSSLQFTAVMEKKPGTAPPSASPPAALSSDGGNGDQVNVERKSQEVHMTLKNQRQVDRAFRRLTRLRDRYNRFKQLPSMTTPEEEASGTVPPNRIQQLKETCSDEELKRSFEAYRDSGNLEKEVRQEKHIDDAMAIMLNWTKGWSFLWKEDPAIREQVLGSVGHQVAEAAAALSGEVVIRLYGDSAHESAPFLNATPFAFSASSMHFRSTTALAALIGLNDLHGRDHANAPRLVVLPGSHTILQAITGGGTDVSRFMLSHIFDIGKSLRMTPELHHLPAVELTPLAPGSVLFMNNFLMASSGPIMEVVSAASPYVPPSTRPSSNPYQYSMSLFPDRCVYDGQKGSWATADSHGPLYGYTKGQPLTDDSVFPVLHRALDIE